MPQGYAEASALLRKADEALYLAKAQGKNRAIVSAAKTGDEVTLVVLEARLLEAQSLAALGRRGEARDLLAAIENEAKERGFLLKARQARELLDGTGSVLVRATR